MAINIFSGSSAKGSQSSSAPKVSTSATRAAASTTAVGMPAAASATGNTAVGSGGIMGKVGSFIKNISGIAARIPGPIGAIGGIVNALTSTNDPEWWQQVPGDGLTTNQPLQTMRKGTFMVQGSTLPLCDIRPAILELASYDVVSYSGVSVRRVLHADDRMVTQYLLPQVRKVINAITLQDASSYGSALEINASIYALHAELLKYDYLLKHGQTFLPTLADGAFPILMTTNAAYLQSVITRLEEYLNASVRLPHTLCEYLTWRYGRLFRSNSSAKAPFVTYDIFKISDTITSIDTLVTGLLSATSTDAVRQKAAADLYNAYADHDQQALLDEASQAQYDSKEFVLRTNLDLSNSYQSIYQGITDSTIVMDSNLDNPTVFMASTVSSYVDDGNGSQSALFPVLSAFIYYYDSVVTSNPVPNGSKIFALEGVGSTTVPTTTVIGTQVANGSKWFYYDVIPAVATEAAATFLNVVVGSFLCKAVDFYNVGLFIALSNEGEQLDPGLISANILADITAISIDAGSVSDVIIRNEQVFAFANLVNEDAKSKTTYKQAEKRVATDVANFVEQTPIATLAPGAGSSK